MARRKKDEDGGGTAVGEAPPPMEAGEQAEMFPELDLSKPEGKEAYNAAKLYRRKRDKRAELLRDAKEEEDAAREKLVVALGAIGVKKFKINGITAEVIDGKKKVRVTRDDDDEEGEEDDE